MENSEQDILIACSVGNLLWLKKSLIGRRKNTVNKIVNSEGYTPLHLAAYQRNLFVLEYLITHCKSLNVNVSTHSTGDTPLHLILSNHTSESSSVLECVQLLLEKQARCNKQNKKGQTSLHLAAELGNIAVVQTLLLHGADFTIKDCKSLTPLDLACLHGNHECARLLKALQWARNKDNIIEHKVWNDRQCKKQKAMIEIVQNKLTQQEVYEKCLEQNKFYTTSDSEPPRATLNTTSSKTRNYPQIAKIQICFDQAQHNIEPVGKPHKLYPYVNYPPIQYRHHATVKRSQVIPKSRPHSSVSSRQLSRQLQLRSKSALAKQNLSSQGSQSSHDELKISKLSQCTKVFPATIMNSDNDEKVTTVSPSNVTDSNIELKKDYDEEGSTISIDDGLTFHEVGPENDLMLLVSPTGTPSFNNIGELFKAFSEPSSRKLICKSHNRLSQYEHHKFKRRLSLSSIPEGEIVTDYNNEGSQLFFDEEFLSSLMPFAFANDDLDKANLSSESFSDERSSDLVSLKVAWNKTKVSRFQQNSCSCKAPISYKSKLSNSKAVLLSSNNTALKTSIFEFGGKVRSYMK